MSLNNAIPQIDDRRYDNLLAEVRTRIARYTPEWKPVWTDVNDSDPGITIVQVFAWLTEMLTYRMSKVPELNYVKFLQLLGIELNPAEAAQAEITFPVKPDHAEPFVIVPARTQVTAEAPDGGPPLVFETERALTSLTASLASIQAFDGYTFTDVTRDNHEATQGFQPFGSLANDDSALLLGFAYEETSLLVEFPQVEVNLTVWVLPDSVPAASFQCGFPDTPSYGPARIRWEFWNGAQWQSLSLLKDETRALTRTGHVYLKTPAKGLQRAVIGAEKQPRYWIRGRVERSQYERPPMLLAIRTNTVAARQAETIGDEVLGGSNGRRDQVFRLANAPVLRDTLRLEVDEGSGYEVWTRVDDFFGSSPMDHHYALDRTTGEVRFGDGRHGGIPVANASNPDANVVAREYRVGGGKRGNVPAKVIKTLTTSVTGVDDNLVANLLAADSGRDEETLDEAKLRAPRSIKSRCRAVTAEDFEYLAMQAATIKRAKALPLFHPDFPGVKVPGVVTVIVVPDGDAPNPTPSDGTLRTVCAYLDQRRLLTTELYVIKPTYQQVEIRVEVIVNDNADLAEVKEGIERALLVYFHPLKGGDDGQGWPFGGTIFFSRVNQRAFTVIGVQSITRLVILLDGEELPDCTDVPITEGALVYSTQHDVQVQYSFDE
ncbi:MAG: putative baseplate assembly protein [Deltaproteobacteria bacterium]|nr:putative baseplate assembly protein [Deltaproteobacteria bacterium]